MSGLVDESRLSRKTAAPGVGDLVVYPDGLANDTSDCLTPSNPTQPVEKSEDTKAINTSEAISLHRLLTCPNSINNNNHQEMVAQDMAQSYDQLFQAVAQEPQEFISLEQLRPHPDNIISSGASSTNAHLYLSERDNDHQTRTYYNLAAVIPNDIRPQSATIHPEKSLTSFAQQILPGDVTPATGGGLEPNVDQTQPEKSQNPPTMHIGQSPAASSHRNHHHHHHHHHHRHHHKHFRDANEPLDVYSPVPRKKRIVSQDDPDAYDDSADDGKSVRTNADSKKQNHSEIEKRRRDKMNTYITELSEMIPMCHAMSRKLDKLTVLRMAVQHLKTILGAVTSYTKGHYKPAFLSDQELKTLILQAAEGFVFVVGCDRGRILYVSESVAQTLNYSQDDLLGQSWFDILHPKDVAKVKEQLSSEHSPRERLIDAKTMLPVKTDVPQGTSRLGPGARRSFFCRMKRKVDNLGNCGESQVKEEADTTTGCHRRKKQQNADWKYCVIQCTGYLKSWAPAKIGIEQEQEGEGMEGENCNISCLVAVGRVTPSLHELSLNHPGLPKLNTITFISRYAIDGKFIFVDQIATLVLGFLPQELLGTSMYEYYHHDDIPHLAESHKSVLQTTERITTQVYRFRAKTASFVRLQSEWFAFKNPWTKDLDYIIAKNSAVFCEATEAETIAMPRSEGSSVQGNYDYFAQSNGGLERLISSHVEVSKIGRRIAEEVLDHQRRSEDSLSSSPTPTPDCLLLTTEITTPSTIASSSIRTIPEGITEGQGVSDHPMTAYNPIRSNVALNNTANDGGASGDGDMIDMMDASTINDSATPLPSDGNDEAAMAVIMSLLEADAGLGGPVDFSGLPWPLP